MQFIDPGTFRHEMRLHQAVSTPDGFGGHSENWMEIATLFAFVEPVSATVRFGAAQEHETVTHRITLRFRDELESGMRLLRQGRIFRIVNVHDPDETGRYLVCRTREEGR